MTNIKIITKDKWVNDLIELSKRQTAYSQQYGKNTLLFDGTTWWSDCSNLQKALFNGRDINDYTIGKFQKDLSNTGDVNSYGLIELMDDISTNFTLLKEGEPRILYLKGHIGAYLGKEIETDHGICNVIESTGSWGGGIRCSYVNSEGERTYGKDGEKNGTWIKHGLPLKWVQY